MAIYVQLVPFAAFHYHYFSLAKAADLFSIRHCWTAAISFYLRLSSPNGNFYFAVVSGSLFSCLRPIVPTNESLEPHEDEDAPESPNDSTQLQVLSS